MAQTPNLDGCHNSQRTRHQEVEAEESKLVEMKYLQPQPMINSEKLEVMGVRGQCIPSDVTKNLDWRRLGLLERNVRVCSNH